MMKYAKIGIGLTLATALFGCVTAPDGYHRVDDFGICAKTGLPVELVGEGGIIPGYAHYFAGSVEIPLKDVGINIPADGKISLFVQKQTEVPPLKTKTWADAKHDQILGLYVTPWDNGHRAVYVDNPLKPQFEYYCNLNQQQVERCLRKVEGNGVRVALEVQDIQNWKIYESALNKVFKDRLVIACK